MDRNDPEKCLDLEVGFQRRQEAAVCQSLTAASGSHGFTISTEMLDNVKALGYKHSTLAALTVSMCRYDHPEGEEAPHLSEAEARGR